MTDVLKIDEPRALRIAAKALALGCTEDQAMEYLRIAYDLGLMTGKRDAYRAQRRVEEDRKARRTLNG